MKALFIFAHPDDESFATGGTIALWVKQGAEVQLVTATRGEAGKLGDPPVTTQENLGKVREQELRAAAKILGISRIHFLDMIDGTLHEVPQKKIVDQVHSILRREKPDIVVTFDNGGLTNHPDHKAISYAATKAFEEYMSDAVKHVQLYHTALPQTYVDQLKKVGLGDVSFGGLSATPDAAITMPNDVSNVYKQKVEAFRCHKSQHEDFEKFLEWGKYIDQKREYFQLILENKIA